MTDFAERYADQNERDYERSFRRWRPGGVEAVEGVRVPSDIRTGSVFNRACAPARGDSSRCRVMPVDGDGADCSS